MKYSANPKSPFFDGVVEGIEDPMKLGRVQVRVFGEHSAQKQKSSTQGIPVEDLPWMTPIQGITSAAISGVGFSPTGIVRGTFVKGYWQDAFHQDGVITGTYAGVYKEKPDSVKGFSDPTGQYPTYIGNDVNTLARGGVEGEQTISVQMRNQNTSVAVNPDDRPLDEIPEDDRPDVGGFTIEKMIRGDEGIRLSWYYDVKGYTIGIGHFFLTAPNGTPAATVNAAISKQVGRTVTGNPGTITAEEVSKLFAQDLADVKSSIRNNSRVWEVYKDMNIPRQMALENMTFQLGIGGVAGFKNALAAMKVQNWQLAYNELRNSTWASQTPGRAARVSKIILTGNLESYGVMVPSPEAKSVGAAAVILSTSTSVAANPEDPFTPGDTRVMFTEPESSYAAVYPYNYVYQSRSGHIQEFDDTPGAERYHRMHPTGTFEEIRPDGTRVVKIVGKDYLIVQDGQNVLIGGNLNVVIQGNANIYNMGNLSQTIDGNLNQFVRGNTTQTVEGEYVGTVKGNAQVTVEKNADITVNQDLTATINNNATINVANEASITAKNAGIQVLDDLVVGARNIDMRATENLTMDGGVMTKITGGQLQIG